MTVSLQERIANARRSIAYAYRCEKEAKALNLSPEQLAVIKTDAEAVRAPAKQLLRILLAEQEKSK